jgi:hypothetical protein
MFLFSIGTNSIQNFSLRSVNKRHLQEFHIAHEKM